MQCLICATCQAEPLNAPRPVGGIWYALCTRCLFETEVETVDGEGAADFRVKGPAALSPLQEADLQRPRAGG